VYTCSGRQIRKPSRYNSAFAFLNVFSPQCGDGACLPREPVNSLLQPEPLGSLEPNPLAMISSIIGLSATASDPDTMTLEEAMRQPDRDEFIKAMHLELGEHIQRKHWKVIPLKSTQNSNSLGMCNET
jgi:hypothetical protein